MRLILSLLFAGILFAVPAVVLMDVVLEQEARSETAADRIGVPFVWPERPQAADPETTLRILAEAAEATGATVVRTVVSTQADRERITHYILLGGDRTALFGEFTLARGRWLSPAESRSGSATVSTSGNAGSVGVPAVFADRYDLTFAPLRQAFDSLPSSGRYVVDAGPATGRFLGLVRERLAEAGVTVSDLTSSPRGEQPTESVPGLRILAYLLAGASTVVIAFRLLREGKRIGVLRLIGHPAARIWYEVVGRTQIGATVLGLGACVAVVLVVPGVDPSFLYAVAPVTAAGFAATLGIGLLVVHRVRISDLVKGSLQ
ncbi:hypothetical protein [Amycolatopsis rubida]|uniref:FtsX-like permease family protein n=1 Tax=Amycolatopsis rubida TaxID=112413 RepID=A0A1I5HTQ2_9PSEU|nr:hypothetical protein [Amycolatopsis rubida]SFO51714.1 hypothetical protein SAMN05421854_10272 [Amycolatopsis rubida]